MAAAIAALLSAATAPAMVSPPPGRKHSVLVPSAAPQRMPMAGVRLALPGRRKAPDKSKREERELEGEKLVEEAGARGWETRKEREREREREERE